MENCINLALAIISLLVGIFAVWYSVCYSRRKSKLQIEIDGGLENEIIRINVINGKSNTSATNINIEACTLNNKKETSYLKIDKEDFLFLPSNDNRIFKAKCPINIENKLKMIGTKLRVRVCATNSKSGFVNVITQIFNYDEKKNIFILE